MNLSAYTVRVTQSVTFSVHENKKKRSFKMKIMKIIVYH